VIIAILGPTAVGKTALSIELAKAYNGEIISGDSVQVYKQCTIGSAKVTKEEQQGIPHHMIDAYDVLETQMSVAMFQVRVRTLIEDIKKRGKTPILVGGTGLYIKSVFYDYNFEGSFRDPSQQVHYEQYTNQELFELLKEKDEEASKSIHMNNRKRVIQALIRSETSKVSSQTRKDVLLYDDVRFIGLRLDRKKLYERINKRVDIMIQKGLETEVKDLYNKGLKEDQLPFIGYKEWFPYFENICSLETVKEHIKQNSRRLAKKQMTFFNHQFTLNWFDVNLIDFKITINAVKTFLKGE
jgi:tRNA dimethylallyltransferase